MDNSKAEITKAEIIGRVVELLDPSQRLLIITGAGISADSGLPTYRGTGGIYDVDDTEDKMPIEQALSGSVFRTRPEVTWKYLAQIGKAAAGASFNRGHEVIAEMEKAFSKVSVLTQNVDGFHTDAGSTDVIEIHGNLRRVSCTACDYRTAVDPRDDIDIPPRCPECQQIVRPDVVLFDETLPQAALQRLYQCFDIGFDMVFSVGTTSVFPYIAEPFRLAHQMGLPAIEINPDETAVSGFASHRIQSGAAVALDEIWKRYVKRRR